MATEIAETTSAVLEQAIETERQRFGVPGVAVAVVRGDEVLVSRGFGHRDLAHDLAVTDRTLFAIGSSTKAFTAALCGALVDDGKLEWDRPVRQYLPRLRLYDKVAGELLTVRDMLSHRSGLPRHDILWYGNADLRREDMVERVGHLQPNKSFRELWQYNNIMYVIAGYLAGELMGCTWEEAVRRRLLEPLGMGDTNFGIEDSERSADHSRPYAIIDGAPVEVPFLSAELCGPAGSINSSIADMTRWVLAHVNGGVVDGVPVISASALKQLHAPTMVLPVDSEESLWPEAGNIAYALGWFVQNYRGHRVLHHGGNINGFSAMVSLLPSQRAGVVTLTNVHPTALRDVVPYVVYDHLLGLDPLPWGQRYKELYDAMLGGVKAAAAHKKQHAATAPPSHALGDYAGRYHHSGYGDVTITVADGRLVPHYNALDLSMEHVHYDTWGLQYPIPDAPPFDLTFETDATGAISALRIPFEASVAPIVFRREADASLTDVAVLRRYTGRYAMGPLLMDVEVDGRGQLVAEIIGQGRVTLAATTERHFNVVEQPGLRFEFVIVDTSVAGSVVVDPAGIFVRQEGNGTIPAVP